LAAPDLILFEVHHAMWKRLRRERTTVEAVLAATTAIAAAFDKLELSARLADEAGRLSVNLRHPIYDCLYLALAAREGATLITDDQRQVVAAREARVPVTLL
jgi:predicted nucleic acid-binding protein